MMIINNNLNTLSPYPVIKIWPDESINLIKISQATQIDGPTTPHRLVMIMTQLWLVYTLAFVMHMHNYFN